MISEIDTQIVSSLAQDIVSELAPEESVMFEAVKQDYLKDGKVNVSAKEEPLGFGIPVEAAYLTPIALLLSKWFVAQVYAEGQKVCGDLVREQVGKLFNKFSPKSEKPIVLPQETLQRIREATIAEAKKHKINHVRAEALADSLIAQLVMSDK